MPFAEIKQNRNKMNVQQPSRKRRASEGSLLKPKPVVVSSTWSNSKLLANNDGKEDQTNESHWKNLFMSLQQERVTAAERQLFSFMKESEKREESLKSYIHNLESDLSGAKKSLELSENQAKDIVELQGKLDEKKIEVKVSERSIEVMSLKLEELKKKADENEELSAQLEGKDAELEMYQVLTATVISASEDVESSIDCCVTNNFTKVSTKYRLTTLENLTEMRFEPLENTDCLPVFLREPVVFEAAECPGLIQNILQGVYPG